MIWRHGILLTLCLALGALAAVYFSAAPQISPASWNYADLRLIDAADAIQPGHDLTAVYVRNTAQALQIRLDMLDHAATPDYDLYLALDSLPGGRQDLPINARADLDWDVLLVIPASGMMQALDRQMQPLPAAGLRVVRDPLLDQVTISLSQTATGLQPPSLPLSAQARPAYPQINLQVWVTPAGSNQMADQSLPSRAGEPPPPPARVVLAFWNTYPAYTPATALRRWNGAHTGPLGGSHGLLHLLRAANAESVPLALLDLKYPAWLSALDFTGSSGLVRQLSEQNLLILPEYLPDLGIFNDGAVPGVKARAHRLGQISAGFGLSPSPFCFNQPGDSSVSTGCAVLFADLTRLNGQPGLLEPTSIRRWQGRRVLTIQRYAGQEAQAQNDGPSLEVRRALSQTALATAQPGGQAVVLALGGDLPGSTWGAASAANATLHYLKSRPWIHFVTAQDLLAAPATQAQSLDVQGDANIQAAVAPDDRELLEALGRAPANALGEAAWQAYLALSAPIYPAAVDLPALRANYRPQVWSLLAAAGWAEHPAPVASCETDPDRDGQADCVLATPESYAQFEIESGALTYLFWRDATGAVHQIIGPSSQVISGLSEPQTWTLNGGLTADPAVIPGAFAQTGAGYQATLAGNGLTFTSADRSQQKTYQWLSGGWQLRIKVAQPQALQIPLLLDPWERLSPGWSSRYDYRPSASGWIANLEIDTTRKVQVELSSNAALTLAAFSQAAPWINRAENPNLDYPAGVYLPFPLAELRLGAAPGEDTIVDIVYKP